MSILDNVQLLLKFVYFTFFPFTKYRIIIVLIINFLNNFITFDKYIYIFIHNRLYVKKK